LRLPRRVVGRELGGELVAELGPVGDGDGIDSGISAASFGRYRRDAT
jgi:hypothetical protein